MTCGERDASAMDEGSEHQNSAITEEEVLLMLRQVKAHGHGKLLVHVQDHLYIQVDPTMHIRKPVKKKSRLDRVKF